MRKTLLQSKTFWFNALTTVIGLATYFQTSDLLVNSPEVIGIAAMVVGVANVLLRLVTKEPVTIV